MFTLNKLKIIGNQVKLTPTQKPLTVDWYLIDTHAFSIFGKKYENIRISDGTIIYTITNQNMGENNIMINDKIYTFDMNKFQVEIDYKRGIQIQPKIFSLKVMHIYDF